MQTTKYSFKRDKGVEGLFSTNRPSTDALKALQFWIGGANRFYEKIKDNDDELIAELQYEKSDQAVGPDLDKACTECGVERTFVDEY